jgi:hypothetical protein
VHPTRFQVECAVGSPAVVVPDVDTEDVFELVAAEVSSRSTHSQRTLPTQSPNEPLQPRRRGTRAAGDSKPTPSAAPSGALRCLGEPPQHSRVVLAGKGSGDLHGEPLPPVQDMDPPTGRSGRVDPKRGIVPDSSDGAVSGKTGVEVELTSGVVAVAGDGIEDVGVTDLPRAVAAVDGEVAKRRFADDVVVGREGVAARYPRHPSAEDGSDGRRVQQLAGGLGRQRNRPPGARENTQ